MTDTSRVYSRHLRSCGFCLTPGGRTWFQQHGLDWKDFIRNGVEMSVLEAIDDALAKRVVAAAKKEYGL